jgi:hypothetical protein
MKFHRLNIYFFNSLVLILVPVSYLASSTEQYTFNSLLVVVPEISLTTRSIVNNGIARQAILI